MKLHCLGTTGFHPSPTRHTACYYIPEWSLVLDAGTGMFRLVEHLLKEPKRSLSILLSHAHLDHIVGLTFLLDAQAVSSLEEIQLIGEAEKLDAVRNHLYHELLFPVQPGMKFVPLESKSGQGVFGPTRVTWFPLEHPGGSLGFRLESANKTLAYVTDTVARPHADYVQHIRNADLLLHECYFGDDDQDLAVTTGHSWLSAVAEIVEQAKPSQTALIHINPLAEILGNGFALSDDQRERLKMVIAEDGMEFNL